MKNLLLALITLLLISCQKDVILDNPSPCRDIPYHNVYMSEFTRMLWNETPYRITKHFTACQDKWAEVPEAAQYAYYVFDNQGRSVIHTGNYIEIDDETVEQLYTDKRWKLYASSTEGILIDWVDFNFQPATFKVEEHFADQFIISYIKSGVKHYIQYSQSPINWD